MIVETDMIQEYQHLLNKIPGILSSRIITDDTHAITEVHILSDITRGPKQIVRDVQSALLAKFDLTIDHKIISVAQIEGSGLAVRDFRLTIDSIRVRSEQGKVEVTVILGKDEQTFEGNASGGNSAQGRLRVVADAALQAVHRFLNKDFLFVLSDAVKINLADRKAIAVSILHFTDLGEEYLSGSAIIKTDDNEAVVKATLDAVNRRLFQHYMK
jgi:hypothetical protein